MEPTGGSILIEKSWYALINHHEATHWILRSTTEQEIFVMPAWIAGIQAVGMPPETSM